MKKGFTLVELLVALVLLGMTLAVGYRLLFFTQNSFVKGEERHNSQQNVMMASELITRELQKASEVKILSDVPGTFESKKRYLYVDTATGILKHYVSGSVKDALGGINQEVTFSSLEFKRNDSNPDILSFSVYALSGSQNFTSSSQVQILNMPKDKDINIDDIVSSGKGKVVCYSVGDGAKSLDVFAIKTEHNPSFPEPFQIDNPPTTIQWWFTKGTDLKALKPYFEYSGVSIKVKGVDQVSGVTQHDFSDPSEPVVYRITAEDGSYIDYTVVLRELEDSPPEASSVKILVNNSDPNIKIPYESSTLEGSYAYIENGNGPEGASQYQWLVSDSEAGPFAVLSGQNTLQFKPSGLAGKWVQFGIRPISLSGVTGQFFYSSPKQIYPDPIKENLFWKHFINDIYIMKLPADEWPEGFSPDVKLRTDYTVESNMDPDNTDLNLTISYPNSAGSTVAGGGSHIYKDLLDNDYTYISDLESFSITVDAQVRSGSGYGVLLYGAITDSNNNKDSGYMFQFDPGWNGFLIRKIENGKHDPWYITYGMGKAKSFSNSQSDHYKYGRYTPQDIRNQSFLWPTDNTSQTIPEWQKRYKTELVLQRQLDNSLIFKATVIDENGNRSTPMWFGNFGTYTADIYDRKARYDGTETYYGRNLPQYPTGGGTILGLRTWDAGGSSYKTEFQEIILGPGFEMNIQKAEFISNRQVKVKLDQELHNTFNKSKIRFNSTAVADAEIYDDPIDGEVLLLDLASPATKNQVRYGAEDRLDIDRGGIKQLYAGDVKIRNGIQYDVLKDTRIPKVISIVEISDYKVTVTFDEEVSSETLSNKLNYSIKGENPTGVSYNTTSVTLTFVDKIKNNDKISISNIQDVAGNQMEPLTNANIN